MSSRRPATSMQLVLVWAACSLIPVQASQERARAALERGEIRPLVELIPLIEADLGGQLVEIELERRGARWVYEAEVLTGSGTRMERDYDAATGDPLGVAAPEDDDDDPDDDDDDDDDDWVDADGDSR